MNRCQIKVWVIKCSKPKKRVRIVPHRNNIWEFTTILDARDYFLSLRSSAHPAVQFRRLLKKQKEKFTETIECINHEDYYVFTW